MSNSDNPYAPPPPVADARPTPRISFPPFPAWPEYMYWSGVTLDTGSLLVALYYAAIELSGGEPGPAWLFPMALFTLAKGCYIISILWDRP